jgi:hypothetical protein
VASDGSLMLSDLLSRTWGIGDGWPSSWTRRGDRLSPLINSVGAVLDGSLIFSTLLNIFPGIGEGWPVTNGDRLSPLAR